MGGPRYRPKAVFGLALNNMVLKRGLVDSTGMLKRIYTINTVSDLK